MTTSTRATEVLTTERLLLRPWLVDDAQAALEIYGHAEVTRWLSPDMDQVPNLAAMRLLLQQWIAEAARLRTRHVGVQPGRPGNLRCRTARQHACRGHGPEKRHALGRHPTAA